MCIYLQNHKIFNFMYNYVIVDDVISVNGTFLEVPDIANPEAMLCVSFESNIHNDRIVVLGHHVDDPKNLTMYSLTTANCTTAPSPGGYVFGLFTQNGSHTLKAPATSLSISFAVVLISESSCVFYWLF